MGSFEIPFLSMILVYAMTSLRLASGCVLALTWSLVASSPLMAGESLNGMPLVFQEDFEKGRDRWETTDDASWEIVKTDGNHTLSLNKRISNYTPKVRSPHNIALVKELQAASFAITFRVRSTKDTGNHRDCCVFFGYQDPEHFYYVHMGAKPDPASGQIMIVNNEPRRPLTENKKTIPWNDDWHNVKLVRDVETGSIDVYFDDMEKPVMTVSDKTFGVGRIGIGSFDDMNEFDDVRIYAKQEKR
jgi:hypothetical protein